VNVALLFRWVIGEAFRVRDCSGKPTATFLERGLVAKSPTLVVTPKKSMNSFDKLIVSPSVKKIVIDKIPTFSGMTKNNR